MENRLTLALVETIILEDGKKYKAKIDTGADSSSIDKKLASKLGEKKIISHKIIRSALGRHRRPTIMVGLEIQGKHFDEKFSIADREKMKYKILIGCDILKKEEFLVDPCMEVSKWVKN